MPLQKVRDVCLLYRKHPTSNAYWERWIQLHGEIPGNFYRLMEAVGEALKQTPRASSLVENLNSRLAELLFHQEAAWPFLLKFAAILPESPLLYAQRGAGTRG
jgi:hypothetical protein